MTTTNGAKLRVGFVGVGAMGQCAHLRNYACIPECDVVAISELKGQQGQLVADHYGVPSVYTDHREMLEKENLDALVAIQLFERHGVIVKELAQSGLPMLIEKPLASSVEVAEEILATIEKSGTKLMVAYHKRSDPATEFVKEKIEEFKESGELGEMRYVRVTMPAGEWINNGFREMINTDEEVPELEMDAPGSSMSEAERGQHSPFINYYIHQVNLVRHLLGEPYCVDYAVPSGVVMAGKSASGVSYVLEMSPYLTTVDWQECAFIGFKRGTIKLQLPPPMAHNRPGKVEILRDTGDAVPEVTVPHLPAIDAMYNQALNFIKFARGEDSTSPCEAHYAIEDLRIAHDYVRQLVAAEGSISTYW